MWYNIGVDEALRLEPQRFAPMTSSLLFKIRNRFVFGFSIRVSRDREMAPVMSSIADFALKINSF